MSWDLDIEPSGEAGLERQLAALCEVPGRWPNTRLSEGDYGGPEKSALGFSRRKGLR